jgi:hypothetical protein
LKNGKISWKILKDFGNNLSGREKEGQEGKANKQNYRNRALFSQANSKQALIIQANLNGANRSRGSISFPDRFDGWPGG